MHVCVQMLCYSRAGGHEQLISNRVRFKPSFAKRCKKRTVIDLQGNRLLGFHVGSEAYSSAGAARAAGTAALCSFHHVKMPDCRGLTRATYILCIEHPRLMRLSRESNTGPPARRRTLYAKNHSDGVIDCYPEPRLVLLQLPPSRDVRSS
jgi:hypothetical protein